MDDERNLGIPDGCAKVVFRLVVLVGLSLNLWRLNLIEEMVRSLAQ